MNMRELITLVETVDVDGASPADQAIAACDDAMSEYGDVVLTSLSSKSSDPEMHEWPLEGDDVIVLKHIEAHEKGQGDGARMMEILCAAADEYGCEIYLDASPFGDGMGSRALIAFYQGFGFERCPEMAGRGSYPMIRPN